MSLPLPHAMALASDDLPDWGAAEDLHYDAQHQSESSREQGVPPGNLHVKRVEMLDNHEEEESYESEQEADAPMGDYERQLNQVQDSFDPPIYSPRTQTDLSDALPRLAFRISPLMSCTGQSWTLRTWPTSSLGAEHWTHPRHAVSTC